MNSHCGSLARASRNCVPRTRASFLDYTLSRTRSFIVDLFILTRRKKNRHNVTASNTYVFGRALFLFYSFHMLISPCVSRIYTYMCVCVCARVCATAPNLPTHEFRNARRARSDEWTSQCTAPSVGRLMTAVTHTNETVSESHFARESHRENMRKNVARARARFSAQKCSPVN